MNYRKFIPLYVLILIITLFCACKGKRYHHTRDCGPFTIVSDARPAGFLDTDYQFTILYNGDKIPLGDFILNPVPFDTPIIVNTHPPALLLSLVKHYNNERELVLLSEKSGHPHFVTLHRNTDYYGMPRAIQEVGSTLLLTGNKLLDRRTLKVYDLPAPDSASPYIHADFFGLSPDGRSVVRGLAKLSDLKLMETEFATGRTVIHPVDTSYMIVPLTDAGSIYIDTKPLQKFLRTYFEWTVQDGRSRLKAMDTILHH
ncbi:hypothetical protein KTO58_13035 [Chitinophaga pendula]|uniref:hypothetical protein n=1 Tax=Chitinophaga TaxID=79328 RepID=UPI000BAF2C6E|nr:MULTISPECIES: hypothetical protein [Chitinophaga]ASZ12327.1 hypothetical protein CK934_15850 [Chitinophaga sp. MD30]UCJ10079.1 hypothetical protein KTO58_13035 [Chitinophaga pendula]